MIGPNGAGKTAVLQALCRLFAFDPKLRRVQRLDFHVPHNEQQAPEERQLWIEADFEFPELEEDKNNSTVAPHFSHMRLDDPVGIPRVRYRLSASMGLDGDIDEAFEYVLEVGVDGSPLNPQTVPRSERNQIQVHYLPARRDPTNHISYGTNALLGRLLRAVNWNNEREEIIKLTNKISTNLAANPSVNAFSTCLKNTWSTLHGGSYFTDPKIALLV